jgi:hypothetical protein
MVPGDQPGDTTMDYFEDAAQIIDSIHDAKNNEDHALARALRADLANLNNRIVADGFEPMEV